MWFLEAYLESSVQQVPDVGKYVFGACPIWIRFLGLFTLAQGKWGVCVCVCVKNGIPPLFQDKKKSVAKSKNNTHTHTQTHARAHPHQHPPAATHPHALGTVHPTVFGQIGLIPPDLRFAQLLPDDVGMDPQLFGRAHLFR